MMLRIRLVAWESGVAATPWLLPSSFTTALTLAVLVQLVVCSSAITPAADLRMVMRLVKRYEPRL